MKSRLAPTPSGYLHIGNAFSFVLTWLLVRHSSGQLLLRIDDIDAERKRPAYVEDIFQTIRWLGLDWDIGPKDISDFETNFSQLKQLATYAQLLEQLRAAGLLYACNCSRAQIQSNAQHGVYPGTCREQRLPLDTPDVAWRVHVPQDTTITIRDITGLHYTIQLDKEMGDFVVRRKNGLPAYQIVSLADDLRYDVDLIVRGADLLPSTAAQLFLAQQLQLESFQKAIFYHHPLLKDSAGQKLSKSAGATSMQVLSHYWKSPAPLYRALAKTLRLPLTKVSAAPALLAHFNPSCLPVQEQVIIDLL